MGTSTDAHCFACSYDSFLMLGGGRANHSTYAAWPVSCRNCSSITTANFKASPLACTECGSEDVAPMTDPAMRKGGSKVVERWADLALVDGEYRCPQCGQFALRFGTNAAGHGRVRWD